MRKILVVGATTATLLLGGAGVANATIATEPVPTSTTTLAQGDNYQEPQSDKTGLWGLVGLLGLAGLAGLKRRDHNDGTGRAGGPGRGV